MLARIADGSVRFSEVVDERAWSWGALWAWVQADAGRVEQYDAALKARAQYMAFESLDIVDEVAEDKAAIAKASIRSKTRLHLAGKWDRGRYGDSSEVKHSGVIGMNLMAVLASLPRAGAEVDVTPVVVQQVKQVPVLEEI